MGVELEIEVFCLDQLATLVAGVVSSSHRLALGASLLDRCLVAKVVGRGREDVECDLV